MKKTTEIPDWYWKANGISAPQREYRFAAPERQWQIDFAWPEQKVAVEIEGGVWTSGRHVRGTGFVGDLEKYNRLTLDGWLLLRYTPQYVRYDEIRKAIEKRS